MIKNACQHPSILVKLGKGIFRPLSQISALKFNEPNLAVYIKMAKKITMWLRSFRTACTNFGSNLQLIMII